MSCGLCGREHVHTDERWTNCDYEAVIAGLYEKNAHDKAELVEALQEVRKLLRSLHGYDYKGEERGLIEPVQGRVASLINKHGTPEQK